MSQPVFVDLTHTSHTAARTGVQRVARGLWRGLGTQGRPITYDRFQRAWRPLRAWEHRKLAVEKPAAKRGAHWPWPSRLRGWLSRRQNGFDWAAGSAGLIVPELFSRDVGLALPQFLPHVGGARIALFHDATAVRLPEFAAPNTVARLPPYLQELRMFDGIAAVSETSKSELLSYWDWLGIRRAPPVESIPLGIDVPATLPASEAGDGRPEILYVSTIEGRKNHVALLDACESLWAQGDQFRVRLIGLRQMQTGRRALKRIAELQAAGRPLVHEGAVDDATVERAYASASFTVYASVAEGFGLPIAESLARGKPCICCRQGAVGETAAGGGCLTVDQPDVPSLREAISRLLHHPAELSALAEVACRRRFKTTADHARELLDWMGALGPKGKVANS
ncbi:MAG TPA: glycosyltransferase [Opitutaceae bacterium]|jgi:glycosyltransferase involved in cell wall biosynthesis